MRNLNRCTFIGTLATDPRANTMPDGTNTAKFILLVPDGKRNTLVPFAAIGNVARVCNQLLRKGMEVYAEGRYQTRAYTDSNGVDQITTEIALENMQILGQRGTAPASTNEFI